MDTKKNYKDTLNLPKTDFPMKANLPVRELPILNNWNESKIYEKIREASKGKEEFILHDGPPFANGDIHLGHVLNKTLKDIIVRHKTMTGYSAPYIPGWDCHGLPIEHKVVEKLSDDKKIPIIIRKRSAQYARKYIDIQRKQFKRLGVFGEWEEPYLTLEPAYEAEILRIFAKFVEKGLIYEGMRPVHWSTGCETALAEAEIEYQDRTDTAIYVKFSLIKENFRYASCESWDAFLSSHSLPEDAALCAAVWTTTPWTLPANLALAIHPSIEYSFVFDKEQNNVLFLASSTVEELVKRLERNLTHIASVKGSAIADTGIMYQHPFLDRTGSIVGADFVTEDSGTGIVHIAPGHGHDDYIVGQKHGLDVLSPVDDQGCLTPEAGLPSLNGVYVFKANKPIAELLDNSGVLLYKEPYVHSYPHCWRSKTPIVFRSVTQWFIRVDAFREKALELIDRAEWFPEWGKNRIVASVSSRQDWCISRQRTWGIPLPVFYDATGAAHLNSDVIFKLADLVEKEGTDVWFSKTDEQLNSLLGVDLTWKRSSDTIDVWIDSGSSFAAVVKKRLSFPADLYLEGSDQHRGWFQSSLLIASATEGKAPYKQVLTHGFVVDGEGKKMSKSVGNVISPDEVMKTYGADILRLWVASADYNDDIKLSREVLKRIADAYRKMRNTLRFLLANLCDFDPKEAITDIEKMEPIDVWALHEAELFYQNLKGAFDRYNFHRAYRYIYDFCSQTMSSTYFDILKDRLYCDNSSWKERLSAQSVLYVILDLLSKVTAPIMPFTAEEVWQHMPGDQKDGSIHLQTWPESISQMEETGQMHAVFSKVLLIRQEALRVLEEARADEYIGSSLDAQLHIEIYNEDLFNTLNKFSKEDLAMIFIVSDVEIECKGPKDQNMENDYKISVQKAPGVKCLRCWKYFKDVDGTALLCSRCQKAVAVINKEDTSCR